MINNERIVIGSHTFTIKKPYSINHFWISLLVFFKPQNEFIFLSSLNFFMLFAPQKDWKEENLFYFYTVSYFYLFKLF